MFVQYLNITMALYEYKFEKMNTIDYPLFIGIYEYRVFVTNKMISNIYMYTLLFGLKISIYQYNYR